MADARFHLHVSVAVAVTCTVAAYTDVRCPQCNRLVMQVPGRVHVLPRVASDRQDQSGRGPVCACKRCGALVEAVVLRAA